MPESGSDPRDTLLTFAAIHVLIETVCPPRTPGGHPHASGRNAHPVTTHPHQAATVQRHGRGQTILIATLLAGLLHLALAALLIGIPASSPTLDPLPTPEGNTIAASLGALAMRLTTAPAGPTPRQHPVDAVAATPTSILTSTPAPTAHPRRATPQPVAVRTTPIRHKPVSAAAPPGISESTNPALRPAASATRPASLSTSPEMRDQRMPPGQTREPPGQAGKSPQEPAKEQASTPPGQIGK